MLTSKAEATWTFNQAQVAVKPFPDESTEFADYLQAYRERFQPVGARETQLVESLARTGRRLARIPVLEESLYLRGQVEFANRFTTDDPRELATLLEAQSYVAYQKYFEQLARQEIQLRRRHERTRDNSMRFKRSVAPKPQSPASAPSFSSFRANPQRRVELSRTGCRRR
jgi:hypothetical protein